MFKYFKTLVDKYKKKDNILILGKEKLMRIHRTYIYRCNVCNQNEKLMGSVANVLKTDEDILYFLRSRSKIKKEKEIQKFLKTKNRNFYTKTYLASESFDTDCLDIHEKKNFWQVRTIKKCARELPSYFYMNRE